MDIEIPTDLPDEIKSLGTPLACFQTGSALYLYIALVFFYAAVACLIGGIGILIVGRLGTAIDLAVRMVIGGVGGLVAGIVLLRKSRRIPRRKVFVSSRGLACAKGEEIEIVSWEDVNNVLRVDEPDESLFSPVSEGIHQVILICRDGRRLVFNETLSRFRDFARVVKEQTLPYMLPAAVEAFQGGAAIGFGEISVSREGLQIGRETLPWELFDSAEVSKGRLTVYDNSNGKKRFGRVDVSKVPNVHVFLALAEYARTHQA